MGFHLILLAILTLKPVTVLASSNSNKTLQEYKQAINSKDFPKAQRLLQKLESNNYSPTALKSWKVHFHILAGRHYRDNYSFYYAKEHFQKAIQLDPQPGFILSLASLYLRQKQYFDLVQLLEKHQSRIPPQEARKYSFYIATAYEKIGNYNGGIVEMKRVLRQNPGDDAAYLKMATLHLKNREPQAAIESLNALARIRPLQPGEVKILDQAKGIENIQESKRFVVSAHFELQVDHDLSQAQLHDIISYLDAAHGKLGKIFDYYPDEKTRVNILYQKDYDGLNQGWHNTLGVHTSTSNEIYIRLGGSNTLENPAMLKNVLWHEYNHHLLRHSTGGMGAIPHWFVEGVAVYLEPEDQSAKWEEYLIRLHEEDKLFDPRRIPIRMRSYTDYVQATSIVAHMDQKGYLSGILFSLRKLGPGLSFEKLFEQINYTSLRDFLIDWGKNLTEKLNSIKKHQEGSGN